MWQPVPYCDVILQLQCREHGVDRHVTDPRRDNGCAGADDVHEMSDELTIQSHITQHLHTHERRHLRFARDERA